VLLPLMNHTIPRYELATSTIKLAKTIPDHSKREACIAAAFAFASKHLNEADREKLMGVFRMTELTELGVMFVMDERTEIARSMLRDKVSIEFVSRHTGLDESSVRKIQDELNSEA